VLFPQTREPINFVDGRGGAGRARAYDLGVPPGLGWASSTIHDAIAPRRFGSARAVPGLGVGTSGGANQPRVNPLIVASLAQDGAGRVARQTSASASDWGARTPRKRGRAFGDVRGPTRSHAFVSHLTVLRVRSSIPER